MNMAQDTPEASPGIHDELRRSLEGHILIESLRETKASPEVIRTAAHVLVDRALDQTPTTDAQRSDFLKKGAGKFGSSGHVKFISED